MAADDRVGYGRPPKHARFRKGQSGNPKGRPKGSMNVATLLHEELQRNVDVREGGTTRRITKLQAMVTGLVNDAAKGRVRKIEMVLKLLDRYGQPDTSEEFSKEDQERIVAELIESVQALRLCGPDPDAES